MQKERIVPILALHHAKVNNTFIKSLFVFFGLPKMQVNSWDMLKKTHCILCDTAFRLPADRWFLLGKRIFLPFPAEE